MIKPTVGRRVWYHPNGFDAKLNNDGGQPYDAGIAYVWTDRMINISVADHNGVMDNRTSVKLVQEGDDQPNSSYCSWMPYQVGQAKRNEEQATA